jgi:homoserine O-acetyltransferase
VLSTRRREIRRADRGAYNRNPLFAGGDYKKRPEKGIAAFGLVWAAWLYSQEWWRKELWRASSPRGTTFEQILKSFRTRFDADANDLILQCRTWQQHNVGMTPGFDGDAERALKSIKAPVLYMPSETDLYFPVGDGRYEATFIQRVTFKPILSLWRHTAGRGTDPEDARFLNAEIGNFLAVH